MNERDLQRIKNERNGHQEGANQRRQLLNVASSNLIDITQRQLDTEELIRNVEASLSSTQSVLNNVMEDFNKLSNLGIQIKEIVTFLSQFKGELSVMHGHQQFLVLLKPLLHSIDNLIIFLQRNSELIHLISDVAVVDQIRNHIASSF